jgi:hypothetical protein
MLIRESALLGLEPRRVALRNNFLSYPGGVDTPVRITNDSYKDGREENDTQYSRINVNLSNRDNHFNYKKKNSSAVVNISLKGKHSKPKSLGRQSTRHTHVLRTITDNRLLLMSYEQIRSKTNNFKTGRKKKLFFSKPRPYPSIYKGGTLKVQDQGITS